MSSAAEGAQSEGRIRSTRHKAVSEDKGSKVFLRLASDQALKADMTSMEIFTTHVYVLAYPCTAFTHLSAFLPSNFRTINNHG
jgi:hypothetical protein